MNKKNVSNRFLVVEFTDNGPGVNETEYEKIFERFYQLKYRNGYTAPGSGIGLSLTRDLIQLINGYIFISSEAGKGTTFLLYFPVSADAFSMAPQSDFVDEPYLSFDYTSILTKSSNGNHNDENICKEIQPADNKIIRKPAILVVDDNQELLDYIFEILNKYYTLILRNDGRVAFQTAVEESIDLIISDVMMPVMDGIEFCKLVKNDLRTSHIPVILLTARSSMENELEGLDSGADDYISKPFNESILIKRVQNTILNRQKVWEKMNTGPAPIPAEIKLSSRDREFKEKAVAIVEEHLSSTRFNQDVFSMEMGMSKASLYRKINGLTNQSINEFVRNIRLKKAAEILRCGEQVHIGELTYQVGFSEPSYFTKKFRELFGETPKSYNNKYINKSRITGDPDEFY